MNRTLNVGNLANELEQSKYFEHKKEQNLEDNKRTGEHLNSSTPEQVNGRTGERNKELISEKTGRVSFNIFIEQELQIEWYVGEKKRSGKKSYNKSSFMRELLDKFFDREKRAGRMQHYREQVNR
jgi:hypothetical protein